MDIEHALLNPTMAFSEPGDVVNETSLTTEQKIQILRRWEYDARELEVAEEENMAGGPPDMLQQVLTALSKLGAEPDPSNAPPTKQGGD